MEKDKLKNTKRRLSFIFAVLVLFIIFILGSSFFTGKFLNNFKLGKDNFTTLTNSIERRLISINDYISFSNLQKAFEIRNLIKKQDENNGTKNIFINFFIIDNKKEELVFNNLETKPDYGLLSKILTSKKYDEILIINGFFVKKVNLKEEEKSFDIIFVKKLNYSFEEYLKDILGFMIFSLLSSIVFYFIGKVFVNNNLKPVEQSINSMQDFVHNAGHELKTPISIIHGNLQLIRQVKKYNKELTNESINELEKLNKLIEGLIELSDINTNLEKKNINITEELEDILKDLNEEIEKKQINIKKSFNNKATISANKQYFYIFVSNIIRNAIKYNKDGGSIEITIKKNIFTIKDNGIGIEKKELKKIFDRFYKIDKSRSSSGYGIGLSLVKKIADIYSRNIKIESELGRGTNFKVFF